MGDEENNLNEGKKEEQEKTEEKVEILEEKQEGKREGEKRTEEVMKEEPKLIKKEMSKSAISSKTSIKKTTDSLLSGGQLTESGLSTTSMGMKRQSEYEKMAKGPRYQNTYRLDPKKPFKPREVYKVMEEIVLREVLDFQQYDTFMASKLVQNIAAEVRTVVKAFNYDRYKICVLVIVGEKKLQGYQCAFRALWDQERDGWTTYFYQCRSYFLSCTCYGLYHD